MYGTAANPTIAMPFFPTISMRAAVKLLLFCKSFKSCIGECLLSGYLRVKETHIGCRDSLKKRKKGHCCKQYPNCLVVQGGLYLGGVAHRQFDYVKQLYVEGLNSTDIMSFLASHTLDTFLTAPMCTSLTF